LVLSNLSKSIIRIWLNLDFAIPLISGLENYALVPIDLAVDYTKIGGLHAEFQNLWLIVF